MDAATFSATFDFAYSAEQWAAIERVVQTQPGQPDTTELRETLERAARCYLIVPRLAERTDRGDAIRAYAQKAARTFGEAQAVLTSPMYARDYSLGTLLSPDERDAAVSMLKHIEKRAQTIAAHNVPLSQKVRQADPQRDTYLAALCSIWTQTVRGKKTTSFRRAGEATGPFVDFIFLAAQPALKHFTRNGAASFIKRWRRMAV